MKISNETLDILKNFSEINQSIVIKPGKKIKTINSLKNILAHADVEEDFPMEVAIYDLTEFLGLLTSLPEAEVEFKDSHLVVSSAKRKVKYFYADSDYVVKPEKEIELPDCEINFKLTEDFFNNLFKTANILQLHDISLKGCTKSNKIYLCANNQKNDTSADYSEEIGEGVKEKFTIYFKRENLKLLPGDYDVSISSKGVSHFKSAGKNLEYWIALEPNSQYS